MDIKNRISKQNNKIVSNVKDDSKPIKKKIKLKPINSDINLLSKSKSYTNIPKSKHKSGQLLRGTTILQHKRD